MDPKSAYKLISDRWIELNAEKGAVTHPIALVYVVTRSYSTGRGLMVTLVEHSIGVGGRHDDLHMRPRTAGTRDSGARAMRDGTTEKMA